MISGGGPPEPYDDPMIRIKKIIEPQIDGLFTLYDGDSELMKLYQETLPENERRCAIESDFIEKNGKNILILNLKIKYLHTNTIF